MSYRVSLVAVVLGLFLLLPRVALAATLLSRHFGVVPQLDTANPFTNSYDSQTHYRFDLSSLAPTRNVATTDYVIADWHGHWNKSNFQYNTISGQYPSGAEPYDVEAYYFDDDPWNLYVAVITSFPSPPGIFEGRIGGSPLVVTGDLALNFGLNGAYSSTDPFNYDYGVNISKETRPSSGGNATSVSGVGQGVYRTQNSDWYTGTPTYAVGAKGEATNFDPGFTAFGGNYLGDAIVNYYQYSFANGLLENGYPTYVIEVTIPRTLFPGYVPAGTTIGISWVEGCRNDGNSSQGILRFPLGQLPKVNNNPVPEPSSMALFGSGFVVLIVAARRRIAR